VRSRTPLVDGAPLDLDASYRAAHLPLLRPGHPLALSLGLPSPRKVLHATVCGGLGEGSPPAFDDAALRALRDIGPIEIELRGLFSGNVSVGRLYLRVYPESRSGTNPLRLAQRGLGRPETDLWLVGIYNLLDNLTAGEARELNAILDEWWDVGLLRFTATHLWLLGARDDLVLDGDPPFHLAM